MVILPKYQTQNNYQPKMPKVKNFYTKIWIFVESQV